jgi:hypothetical protein
MGLPAERYFGTLDERLIDAAIGLFFLLLLPVLSHIIPHKYMAILSSSELFMPQPSDRYYMYTVCRLLN